MKKKFIFIGIFIVLLLILSFLAFYFFKAYSLKNSFEKTYLQFANQNEKTIFSINKIVFFSSCNVKDKIITNSGYNIKNLYQYTDMAFFITNNNTENSLENTPKTISIRNINYSISPSIGTPKLYYKNINSFAKSDIIESNLIENEVNFTVSSENEANLDTPTLYNNLANPIVLSYYNENIKEDYTISNISSPITLDGTLLKKCNILLNSITCRLSFDIYISNYLDQEFKTSLYFDIPLETPESSIYGGKVILKEDTNYTFYRYK